jgi:hypothetical protein
MKMRTRGVWMVGCCERGRVWCLAVLSVLMVDLFIEELILYLLQKINGERYNRMSYTCLLTVPFSLNSSQPV